MTIPTSGNLGMLKMETDETDLYYSLTDHTPWLQRKHKISRGRWALGAESADGDCDLFGKRYGERILQSVTATRVV